MMDGFSFSEIIIIIIVAIIIYGKDLPQAARKLATMYSKFKRQLSDVREEISRQIPMDEIRDTMNVSLPEGPGGEPPTTPTLLTASPGDSNVLLTWNASSGASTYTIRRQAGPEEAWLIVAMSIPELAWTDTDVQPGKTYRYSVSGVNGTGESGSSDEVIAVIPGGEVKPAETPAAPATETPAPAAAAPANGNGDYPKEPAVPEEKGATSAAPEVKPS